MRKASVHCLFSKASRPSNRLGGFTYRTHEAGVVPGESQRLQELVARFDGEVASVTAGAEEGVVI